MGGNDGGNGPAWMIWIALVIALGVAVSISLYFKTGRGPMDWVLKWRRRRRGDSG